MEARGFRDAIEQFRGHGAEVIGVSADRREAQARFVDRLGIPFPMGCDPDGSVLRAYGVRGLTGYAKRVSFLIDRDGIVRKVYTKVSPRGHAEQVLHDLGSLVDRC